MNALGCVTGRFQPVHAQHLELFEIALGECGELVVAITNPDPGTRHREAASAHRHTAEANPFTYFERLRLIAAVAAERELGGRITIVPFELRRPESWFHYAPPSARQFVRTFAAWEREKARRLAARGYAVTALEGDSATRVSASDVRAAMRSGDGGWRRLVPAATVPLLETMLERADMRERARAETPA